MQIIAVSIQKGGTGKTTTAALLAQAAAYKNKKALAVDADPQGNLSFTLQADVNRPGSYELITGSPAEDLIQHTAAGLDVIAAGQALATLTTARGSARRLQKALRPLQPKYDVIVIDTPTQPGELLYNALQAATGVLIPLQAETFSLQSFYQTVDTVRQIQHSNPGLSFKGTFLNKINARARFARQMKEIIEEKAAAADVPFLGTVRAGVAVQEAAALQRSLYDYDPDGKPAQDFLKIFDALQI